MRRRFLRAKSRPSTICVRHRAIAAALRRIYSPNFAKCYLLSTITMLTLSNDSSRFPGDTYLVVRGSRVITPGGERRASIHIRQGLIAKISAFDDIPAGWSVCEAGESVVMPGLVDTHVHINEPGRTEWEGFSSATQAAAAGGVTTLIEMPLNSISATTTAVAYRQKVDAAADKLRVDVGFWGGVVP